MLDGPKLGTSLGALDMLGILDGYELSVGTKLIVGVAEGSEEGSLDGCTDMVGS